METIDRLAARTARPPRHDDSDASSTAAAATAAQAARDAAQGVRDPVRRAELGWALAEKTAPANAGVKAQAIAAAGTNVRTATERTDLSPEQSHQVKMVLERLGNAVLDGRLDPHLNDDFRQAVYTLATQKNDGVFAGALAQLHATADVLDRAPLADGTRVAYDPRQNGDTGRTGLPAPDVPKVDADVYYRTDDQVLNLRSAKSNPGTLSQEVDKTRAAEESGKSTQLARQADWLARGTEADPRALSFHMVATGPHFDKLVTQEKLDVLSQQIGGDETSRRFVIGDRAYSIQDFRQIMTDRDALRDAHVESLRQQHVQAGGDADAFDARAAGGAYNAEHAGTPERTMRTLGKEYGAPRGSLQPLPTIELPTARQGGLYGALGAAAITTVRVGSDGQLTGRDLRDLAGNTAFGAGTGALAAAGERAVTPMIDRAAGASVQRIATTTAARVAPQAAAETSIAFGASARSLATRVGGASVVGAAIGAGVSAYENRDGLAKGDSQAIGNVVADTGVAVTSVAAAMGTGALVGSVVPGVGTVVGAAAGLVVGVGVAYGAQISGARDAVADTVSGWVDGVKGWF